jgi:hypothetical protein
MANLQSDKGRDFAREPPNPTYRSRQRPFLVIFFSQYGRFRAARDASDADYNPTHTVLEQKKVNRTMSLKAKLVSGGGQAIRIRPAK